MIRGISLLRDLICAGSLGFECASAGCGKLGGLSKPKFGWTLVLAVAVSAGKIETFNYK